MEQARITSHQGTQGAHAARGKPAAQAADPGAGSGGFLSLLTALGDAGLQDPLGPQPEGMGLGTANDPAAVDAAALAALQGGFLPWQLPDTVSGTGAQATAALAGTQGLALNGIGVTLNGLGITASSGQGVGLLPQNGLVAQTALLDATMENLADDADAVGLQGSLQAPPAGGLRRTHSRGQGVAPGGDVAGVAQAQVAGKAGTKNHGDAASLQGVATQPQAAERRDVATAPREAVAPVSQDTVAALSALVPGAMDAAPGGRESGRSSESGGREPGAWGAVGEGLDIQGPGLVDGSSASVDPAMVPAEDAVAEQVAFWVHQNIQNAELTVKHDGQPVEVSVSLTGNEAHVAFRSDQAQTRDLLDSSVAQLRDMLRQEGLVLSGVTVGDSGSQPSGDGGAQRGQQGAPRSAQVVVPAVAGARTRSGADVLSDRAVDIFV